MEPGTWVALVVGAGSLLVTLELDRRNRQERRATAGDERAERDRRDTRERSERRRTRWTADRLPAYTAYLDGVETRINATGHQLADLHHGVWRGYPKKNPTVTETPEEDLVDRVAEASRQIALLAPRSVAERCEMLEGHLASLEWSVLLADVHLSTGEATALEPENLGELGREFADTKTALEAVRRAMRSDLDVDR